MNTSKIIKKAQETKVKNKIKLRITIDVVDIGDGKEDIIVQGPFGGSEKAKIMTLNIMAAAQMKVCHYQEQSPIKLPTNNDVAEANKNKIV